MSGISPLTQLRHRTVDAALDVIALVDVLDPEHLEVLLGRLLVLGDTTRQTITQHPGPSGPTTERNQQ